MVNKRQQQVGRLVHENLGTIIQKHGYEFLGKAFVTISGVEVTPDLLLARVYISVYNVSEEDKETVLVSMKKSGTWLRKRVGAKIRNKVRQIPQLEFHLDKTLDSVFELENLFEKMGEEEE